MAGMNLKAPDYFLSLIDEADAILALFRSEYPELKLTDEFMIPSQKLMDDIFLKLPAKEQEELSHGKACFESLWQAAWKKLYYVMPASRHHDWSYITKTRSLKEIVRRKPKPNPVPLKEPSGG